MSTIANPGPGVALEQAMAEHRAGRLEVADALYRRAIAGDPGNAQALRLRGVLARERGDAAASARYLARAAELAPGDPRPWCELASTAMAGDDLDAAVRHLRAALARDPAHGRSLANLGALLQYRGHVLEAIDCHARALDAGPGDVEVRCNLAKALAETGRGEDGLAVCDEGLERAGAHPLLLGARGAVLCDLERFGEAVAALEGALVRNPDDDMAWISLGYARARLGRHEAAIEALRAARRANPASGRATADLVNLLAGTNRAGEALALAADYLGDFPGERHVLAAQAFALGDAGRREEAAALLDFDRLVRVVEPAAPPGYADLAAFNAALRAAVESDPSQVASPASKSTRGGMQTGELDLGAHPALRAFAAVVGREVRAAAEAIRAQGLGAHPAMAWAAEEWSLRAWGTVLEAGGAQLPHIHPLGWLSGCWYVELPPGMGGAGAADGWIEFGSPPARFLVGAPPAVRRIEPRPGRLALFPSYFYHRTLPFTGPGRRISIAFDVLPRRAG